MLFSDFVRADTKLRFTTGVIMNAMNSVLNQVQTSSRAYLTWMALRAPEPAVGSTPNTATATLAPADFNQSWTQFAALAPAQGIPELESPLSD